MKMYNYLSVILERVKYTFEVNFKCSYFSTEEIYCREVGPRVQKYAT